MKKKTFHVMVYALFLTALLFTLSVTADNNSVFAASPPTIRVGITLTADHLSLTLQNGDILTNQDSGESVSLSSGTYRLENSDGAVRIRDTGGKSYGVYSGPLQLTASRESFKIENARYGSNYRGALEISAQGASGLNVVNVVDLESYLRGVVPREMPPAWGNYGGMEALKAQVVAARTYALYYLAGGRHSADPYDLCDTQHCQVYGGINCEHDNTDQAVKESRGDILTYDGEAIAPFYHSTNAGYTECASNVWTNSLPFLQSKPDPYDDPHNPDNIRHSLAFWEKDVPLGAVNSLLAGEGIVGSGDGKLQVVSQFSSNRVDELRISGGGQSVSYYKERARTVLGLRSQFYSISEQPEPRVWVASAAADGRTVKTSYTELEGKWALSNNGPKEMLMGESFSVLAAGGRDRVPYLAYIIEGKGWGHGVGMSQYGAYNRARAGHSYRDILSFYYPGTELRSGY